MVQLKVQVVRRLNSRFSCYAQSPIDNLESHQVHSINFTNQRRQEPTQHKTSPVHGHIDVPKIFEFSFFPFDYEFHGEQGVSNFQFDSLQFFKLQLMRLIVNLTAPTAVAENRYQTPPHSYYWSWELHNREAKWSANIKLYDFLYSTLRVQSKSIHSATTACHWTTTAAQNKWKHVLLVFIL